MITIRRMTEADAVGVNTLLATVFANDTALSGCTARPATFLASQVQKGIQSWVAIENNKIIGVLGPQMSGTRATDAGERTFHYFNRGIVATTKTAAQALIIARDLSLFAVADVRAQGNLPDDIMIEGASACRGATWCRRIGCEETDLGDGTSRFVIPLTLLESRFKAVK